MKKLFFAILLVGLAIALVSWSLANQAPSATSAKAELSKAEASQITTSPAAKSQAKTSQPGTPALKTGTSPAADPSQDKSLQEAIRAEKAAEEKARLESEQEKQVQVKEEPEALKFEELKTSTPETPTQAEPAKWQPIYGKKGEITNPLPSIDLNKAYESQYTPTLRKSEPQPTAPAEEAPKASPSPKSAVEPVQETKWQPVYGEKGEILNPEQTIQIAPNETYTPDKGSTPNLTAVNIFSQNFEATWDTTGVDHPTGWVNNDNGTAGTRFWSVDDWHKFYYSTWTSNCARIQYYPNAETTYNEWLITPAVSLTGGATACSLTWRNYYYHRTSNDSAIVKISTDNGATWVDSIRWGATQASGYKKINLTAYAGQTVKAAFVFRANANPYSNAYYWYIDDVKFFADGTTLLNENFETWGPGGDNPPSSWAILDSGAVKVSGGYNLNDWQRYANSSWTGNCARVYYISSSPYDPEWQNEELITPAISISSGAVCTLSMVEYYYHTTTTPFDGYDHGYILVSTNSGATWPETLANHTTTIGSSSAKNTFKYVLSSHAGQSIMLKFKFVNSPIGYCYWMFDDISVDEVDPSAHNVGTVSIVSPTRAFIGNNDIKVRVRNNGINTETFRDTVKIVQTSGGTAFFSENFSNPQSWTGANPPVNPSGTWTILDSGSTPGTWDNQDWHAAVFLGDTAAYVTYASGVNQNEWLITPAINCTGRTNVHLKFRMYFNWEGTTDTVWVYGTTDNWSTKVQIAKYAGADVGSSSAMAVVDSNISAWAANQSSVKIGFKYLGYYDLYCYIDDVQLFEPAPPTTVYTQSILVSGLAGMAETTLVFPQWNATAGTYELTTFTALTTDVDRTNDTLRAVYTPIVHDGTGGPDQGYYVWKDNTVVGGPTFNWVDMSAATVCTLSSYETGISTAKSLGGTFSYYGTNYDYIKIAACGTVTFDTSITYLSYSNTSIPSTAAPNAILAAYWDDMNSSVGHLKYWNDVANNRFVIQYDSLCHYGTALRVDLQIILDRDDSSITYQYNNLSSSLQTDVTIGIENPTGTTGLSYYFTTALLGGAGNFPWNGLAIKFYPALPTDDIVAISVLNPPTTIQAGYGYPVSGIVRNGGTASQTFNVIMRADTLTSGIAGYWADTVNSVTLGAGLTDTIDFDPFTAAAIDTFRFVMKVVNPGDAYTSNDSTAYKTVYAPNVIPTHDIATVAINSPIYITEGRSFPVSASYYNNGGNSETFTANFQMYGTPLNTVYSENFNSGLPGTWTVIDSLSDTPKTWLTSAVHDATYPSDIRSSTQWELGYMIVDVDAVGSSWPMSEQLLTPWYNFTGYSNLHLAFSHYYYGSTSYTTQVGKVEIRQGQAGAWTNLATYTTAVRQQAEDFDISAYADNLDSIQVRFWYRTTEYAWYWGIDNVKFYYQGAPVTNYTDSKPAPSLAPLVRDTISTFNNLTGPVAGPYYLKTWHNLATDVNIANDTLTVPITVYAHTGSSDMDLGYYSYKDNINGGGPAYSWKDISGTGTAVSFTIGSADDGSTPSIPLGFTFPFYGNNYSNIYLSENGFASFDSIASSTGYYTNSAIPSTSAPNNLLAFFWDDVKKGTAGSAYYYTNNVDTFIVSYLKWTSDGTSSDTLDAQFILSKNDRKIKFQYRRFGPSMTLSHTIGIENSTGATGYGTQYVYNGSPMGNLPYAPLAITFSHTPPAHDIAAVSVIAPTGYVVSGTTFTPKLRESNLGAFPDTFSAFFDIYFGASRVYHDSILNHPLGIGISDTVSFTPTSLVPVGAYRCTTYVVLAADSMPSNNKITSTFSVDKHYGKGGPDAAYYYWIDNTEVGGPTFSWVDMSAATVCTLSSYDTGVSGAKALGGTFRFYGNNYDSVKVGANAVLTFDLTTTSIGDANYIMPTAATPNNLMAACWDDMNNRVGSITYLKDVANNRFVVQYDSIVFYGTSVSFDLQVILNWSNNTIVYQYNNIVGTLQTDYTIGIENSTGTAGLSYIFDNNKPLNAFSNGLAIKFYQDIPTHEIATLQFLTPPSLGVINVPVAPQVVFGNYGINNEPSVPVRLLITPGTYNNPQTASIDTAARDTVTFASFTPTSGGAYTLTAIAELGTDVVPSTDTLNYTYTVFDTVVDFEANDGGLRASGSWGDFTGDWEYGTPSVVGPATPHSGSYCWGTIIAGYRTPGYSYGGIRSWLDMQIDVGSGHNASFGFYEWYYTTSYDTMHVFVDTGAGWMSAYVRNGYYTSTAWTLYNIDLSAYTGIIKLRFDYYSNSSTSTYAGWYLDDFAFMNCAPYHPPHDMTPQLILAPTGSGAKNVAVTPRVVYKNNATTTETSVPVRVIITPGVYNNAQSIASIGSMGTDTVSFTNFTPTTSGTYTVTAIVSLGTDVDPSNDTLVGTYEVFDQVIDFESSDGGFQTGGGTDWQYGTPAYVSGPASAHSPVNCWGTNLTGTYTASTVSDLMFEIQVSDTAGGLQAIWGFYQWYYYESSWDGGDVSVSTDNGATWTLLHPLTGYTGYQNSSNPLPGQDSIFTGSSHNYWHATGFDLSAYSGQVIGIKMSSGADGSGQYAGWYIDDFAFLNCGLNLPTHDIQVASITSPYNQLQGGQTYSIKATVRNKGANAETFTVKATDNHGFTNTQTVTALPSLNQATVTFPGWSVTACNNYELSVIAQLGTDINRANDTLQKVYDAIDAASYSFVGYDSPGIANAYTWASTSAILATQFDVASPATGALINAIEFKFLAIGDPYWPWPNATHDPVQAYIFTDSDNDGVPDGIPLFVDTVLSADSGWTVWPIDCVDALRACNTTKFWVGFGAIDVTHLEGLATDSTLDNLGKYWSYNGSAWSVDTIDGDYLLRADYDTSSAGTVTIAIGSLSVTGSALKPASDTVSNTIDNTGNLCDMSYSTTVIQDTPFRPRHDIGDIQHNSIRQAPLGYATTSDAKGTRTEPYYPPQLYRSGGPDSYGYRYKDSDEVGGPTFSWIDITGTGTAIALGDDDVEKVPMGFSFPFYGNNYDSIYIISNGYLGFGVTSSDFSNDSIPYSSTPNNLIAIWWDDLDPTDLPNIYYHYDSGMQAFIVSYVGVPNYNSTNDTTGSLTFQAILYANGNIKTQYLTMNPGIDSLSESTIGIENSSGTVGLQVVYNQAYMTDNRAILFTAPVFWLSTDLTSGTLAPAAPAMPFNIFMKSVDLDSGTYLGRIIVNSNDLANPSVTINVSFTVTGGGGGECDYLIGDISGDGQRIGGDVTYGVRYFKGLGNRPPDSCFMDSSGTYLYVSGDCNGNCEFRGSDITRLVAFFKGLAHLSCCHWFPTTLPPIILNTPNPIDQMNPGTAVTPRNDDQAIIGTQKTTR